MAWLLQSLGLLCSFIFGTPGGGYLVTRETSLNDLVSGTSCDMPVFFYTEGEETCWHLKRLLRHNYYPFGLGTVGIYHHPYQCFFDVERRRYSGGRGWLVVHK